MGGLPRQLVRVLWIVALVGCGLALHAQVVPAVPLAGGGGGVEWLGGIILILLMASGLISSSETALFSLDKLDQSQMRGSASPLARMVLRLLDRPNDTLITILILNNFVNIAISLATGALTERLFAGRAAEAFTLAAVGATAGILMFGEILPKMLAHNHPRQVVRLLAPPLAAADWLLTPLRVGLKLTLRGLFRLLAIPEVAPEDEVSEEELKVMINSGEVSQVLEEDELEMIDGVFELRHTQVEEILTPRTQINAVSDTLEQDEMLARLREHTNNRVLVFHDTLDELIGFLLVKEVLLEPEVPWRDHLREALHVPEQMLLLDLLKQFRRQRMKMAVVVDEYGGVAGIVTLQDVLEEIVGDIYEKHEQRQIEIEAKGEGVWLVNGSVDLEEAGKRLGVTFPSRRGRTIGGFVMNMLGRIPHAGDALIHEGLRLRVLEMVGRRVFKLEITPAPETPSDKEAGS